MTARKQYRYGDPCKYGHTISPENSYSEDGLLRCLRCTTHCTKGHPKTPENWKRDARQYRCVPCLKRVTDAYRKTEWGREKARLREARARKVRAEERDRLAAVHKNDEKRSAPHNTLGVRDAAAEGWAQLNEGMDRMRTPCFTNRDQFIEFADPRYPNDPEEQAGSPFPSTGEAEAMCAGCPLAKICLEYALAQKEDFGVWGGKRIVNGRVYRGARKVVDNA